MEKPEEIADLNNLTQGELRKQVLEWTRSNGISEKLHSQLRCDLISSFNKTLLGRYIESQFQAEYRMVLCPVTLSLNTLVAEFLYAQNCHYSLSVFSTEVPFKNTLPEFEKRDHFRFNKSELNEIFQALGIESKHLCDNISNSYYKPHSKGNSSLLFFIFQHLLNKNTLKKASSNQFGSNKCDIQNSKENVNSATCSHSKNLNLLQTQNSSINQRNLKYINKYLYISIKKIYKLAKKIDKLELTNSKNHLQILNRNKNQKSPSLEEHKHFDNLLSLNKNLENLTEEFKKLMATEKISKESVDYSFIMLINDVTRITNSLNENFETCNHNISQLLKYFTEQSKTDEVVQKMNQENIENPELDYKGWLESIKESKHGNYFLKKLEANFTKTLLKERQQYTKEFDERLEKEKLLIKMHYRQKYLEHLSKRKEQSQESETHINALQGFIVQNTKFIEHSDRILHELDKKSSTQINSNSATELSFGKKPVHLSQHPVYCISIEPKKIDEITQTIVPSFQLDDHVENFILDAKKRILELDKESEQLDQYFQTYLQRQLSEKSKYKLDISKIWHTYNAGRVVLNSKTYNLINPMSKHILTAAPNLTREEILLMNKNDIFNLNVNKNKDQSENPQLPFNFLNKHIELESNWQHSNIPKISNEKQIESPLNADSFIKNKFENLPNEIESGTKYEISKSIDIIDGSEDLSNINQST